MAGGRGAGFAGNNNQQRTGGRGGGRGGGTAYQRQLKGKNYAHMSQAQRLRSGGRKETADRAARREKDERFDSKWGYERHTQGAPKLGWLFNLLPISLPDDAGLERSGVDCYFIEQDGSTFKATVFYEPYFYLAVKHVKHIQEVIQYLQRRFETQHMRITICEKEDLDLPNHLSGLKHKFLKLSFSTVAELIEVKSVLKPIVDRNRHATESEAPVIADESKETVEDFAELLSDMREYDVPYVVRTAIDNDLRVGGWYLVEPTEGKGCSCVRQEEIVEKADVKILAFDIECTKAPLKFPVHDHDQIFMISYMCAGQGFLVINREVVSEDVQDFEYTPKPNFPGPFTVFNERDEESMLRKFLSHIQELKPQIIVTYNGDFFDWPFVDARCAVHGINMYDEVGFRQDGEEYRGRCSTHMDCFAWVKRDSYLPNGSHGLKAVTKHKLGYDPVEVDPEDMMRFARENPHYMASYSVSDAVATYYLYEVYVHFFVFSLCTIIPMGPEDVLRKGSGTLCEALLMVEAYKGNIICPNKQIDPLVKFHKGHLLDSETYIGGHVECLETGVFRADIPAKFKLVPSALQSLIDNIDRDLAFALEVENGTSRSEISNYEDVRQAIVEKLELLRDSPMREECPSIYHLDVAAMYPNIILTNRLQPCAIVSQADCAACVYNREENQCKRAMAWVWRGDYNPASYAEYDAIRTQLSYERVGEQAFTDLPEVQQAAMIKARLKAYSSKVYKKSKVTEEEQRVDTVCMRENPFYVNTVRAFRDRRYDYKILTKKWKKIKTQAEKANDPVQSKAAGDKEVLFDSLQLAHKCILNSFYGYVMRRGARWRSMEMAGIVTNTGSSLITQARELVEQIGRPLELDTDGIWCILPVSFPQNFTFDTVDGGRIPISYPCVMLNADVHERYTNHQYQSLADEDTRRYATHSECSIFFELDGPYRCMMLPASPEEGKLLKKRYAVFNFDGTLAELKGFELKRRGELELVKIFQGQVFERFLAGGSLDECYNAVGAVANQWLDVLDTRGEDMDEEELMELISENRTISKTLEDYGDQKATSLTTAARLADFLGDDMVKDKGLNCKLVISNRPAGAPVTERAIPVAIFSADPAVTRHYLRKWLKDPSLNEVNFRDVVDWQYYKDRLGKAIQKIVTIPAAMQHVVNPVPRILHPDWLERRVKDRADVFKQRTITDLFGPKVAAAAASSPIKRKKGQGSSIAAGGATPDAGSSSAKRALGDDAVPDIEDMLGGSTSNSGGKGTPVAHMRSPGTSTSTASTAADVVAATTTPTPTSAAAEAPQVSPLMKSPPETSEELQSWLAARKQQWKVDRLRRQNAQAVHFEGNRAGMRRRLALEEQDAQVGKRPMGVQDFVRNASLAVAYGYWQVFEIQETEMPGEFFVWAMTGKNTLQRIQLTVPRTFYVNCMDDKSPIASLTTTRWKGKKVDKVLPHGHTSHHLYEVSVSERKFATNAKALGILFSDPGVEGVYEMKMPLLARAIMHMGCVSQVARSGAGGNQYKLDQVESVSTKVQPYLSSTSTSWRRIYIYRSVARSQTGNNARGILGMFVLDGTFEDAAGSTDSATATPISAKAFVWLITPMMRADTKPPMQRIFQTLCRTEADQCKFSTVLTGNCDDAEEALNQELSRYSRQRQGPTAVIAQGSLSARQWRKSMSVLHDYPLLAMPSNAEDELYPALGWQTFCAQRMVQRLFLMPEWLNDRMLCARYASIPISNLGADAPRSMSDFTFARLLRHNRHVLWAAECSKPDLGGAEEDENEYWADSLEDPRMCNPGAYRGICVELDVYGLAVNAIMSSAQLDTQGVSNLEVTLPGAGADAGSDSICGSAFRLLKTMVSTWITDVGVNSNVHADALLVHMYRWLCSRQSLLHDPALHRVVYRLMHKLFARMVSEFRRLGAHIVYADYNRIILNTTKTDEAAAREYLEFILNTLTARDVFQYLQITPSKYWEQLLFLDPENYGGIQLTQELEQAVPSHADGDVTTVDAETEERHSEPGFQDDGDVGEFERSSDFGDAELDNMAADRAEASEDDVDVEYEDYGGRSTMPRKSSSGAAVEVDGGEDDQQAALSEKLRGLPPIITHWNIAEFLPHGVRQYFFLLVGEYLYKYREYRNKLLNNRREQIVASLASVHSENAEEEAGAVVQVSMDDGMQQELDEYMRGVLKKRFTPQLLEILGEFEGRSSDDSFPVLAGSHLRLSNVPLEFVKTLCEVLGLDRTFENEVEALRRTLLLQLGIREFSHESEFKDPSLTYVFRDLICSFCNACRDLDFLRDPDLMDGESGAWKCAQCGHMYDVADIELQLVERAHQRSAWYQLQDLRCSKTHSVSTRLMSTTSEVCAPLMTDVTSEEVQQELNVLLRVAEFHHFEWLEETVRAVLQ